LSSCVAKQMSAPARTTVFASTDHAMPSLGLKFFQFVYAQRSDSIAAADEKSRTLFAQLPRREDVGGRWHSTGIDGRNLVADVAEWWRNLVPHSRIHRHIRHNAHIVLNEGRVVFLPSVNAIVTHSAHRRLGKTRQGRG
jgi:hypothetical protein